MSCLPLQSPEALWRTELADLVAVLKVPLCSFYTLQELEELLIPWAPP